MKARFFVVTSLLLGACSTEPTTPCAAAGIICVDFQVCLNNKVDGESMPECVDTPAECPTDRCSLTIPECEAAIEALCEGTPGGLGCHFEGDGEQVVAENYVQHCDL